MQKPFFHAQECHIPPLVTALHKYTIWGILLSLIFAATPYVDAHAGATSDSSISPAKVPEPEDATRAIIESFNKFEVVGLGEAHNRKDLDDFILSLIRNPDFPTKVNDIVVECGNSLYQSILDQYISGDNVPFPEVRQVWRNTTQPMCSLSGFFEELFPLVRRINQKLPSGKKLRVLAGDPPIDWNKVKGPEDLRKPAYSDRDANISSVMEKEILSKHHKALMLFGEFHLFHDDTRSAVGRYEKEYPNLTYVIVAYRGFGNSTTLADQNALLEARMIAWPIPSIISIRGTWLADLDKSYFFSPLIIVDQNCKGKLGFPEKEEKTFARQADALLYLGPRDTLLAEQTPADIVLDADYLKEMQRRIDISKFPWNLDPQNIVASAGTPFMYDPEQGKNLQPILQNAIKACLDNRPPTPVAPRTSTPQLATPPKP